MEPLIENILIAQRRHKLDALRAKGIDPFKNKFAPGETCKHARDNYAEGREVAVAGRITAHREMGKSMFIDVRDQSGRLQIYAQKNHLEETAPGSWDTFTHLDLGDFIGARGKLFTTKTGEISIKLDSFVILAKALRPPPAKWHGLEDTEIRYRQRYLDLMANPEVKDIFLKRSEIIREIRNFLHSRGFVEVETPMMQAIPGGAAAQPFKTHHNALGCDFYLRIALELYLKRLLVGGVDKVFEIGRNFRNEGLSRKHNPEFTMLEAYQAFGDYESMMELVESMVKQVAQKVLGTLTIKHDRKLETDSTIHRAEELLAEANVPKDFERHFGGQLTNLRVCFAEFRQTPYASNEKSCQRAETAFEHLKFLRDLIFHDFIMKYVVTSSDEDPKVVFFDQLESLYKKLDDLRVERIINLEKWKHVKYKDIICNHTRPDWFEISTKERLAYAEQILGVEVAGRPLRKFRAAETGKLLPLITRINELTANGLNILKLPEADKDQLSAVLAEMVQRKEYVEKGVEDFEISQAVFEKLIEPTLIQPTFVTHLPKELVPLAKLSPDDPTTVEVFECCINGQEIAPAYTEQNDPIEQRERLEHQAGGEQQKLDEDFLVALEHGMPPAGGMGMGIDRLCMMLLGQESIRDVILFPQLKPK